MGQVLQFRPQGHRLTMPDDVTTIGLPVPDPLVRNDTAAPPVQPAAVVPTAVHPTAVEPVTAEPAPAGPDTAIADRRGAEAVVSPLTNLGAGDAAGCTDGVCFL
jgi:hypothetical protein